METVLLTKDELQAMLNQAVELAVSSYVNAEKKVPKKAVKSGSEIDYIAEIEKWIPLKVVFEKMGISRQKWYRKYQHIMKHKPYGGETWVYAPSIYEFFTKNNIN